ncbi:hypothetical protein DFQ28_007141 [Apophysomyces sp. BC1034]|nr:hypothetical protein DFQ30_007069 [Apophysomyces sp. BC1015]KAG0186929.1 hypothetical protein DFQ28_007141 [Apophysomyces sp. BC1034]
MGSSSNNGIKKPFNSKKDGLDRQRGSHTDTSDGAGNNAPSDNPQGHYFATSASNKPNSPTQPSTTNVHDPMDPAKHKQLKTISESPMNDDLGSEELQSTNPEPTPLPAMQLFVIGIMLISEPLTSTILFPFIYYMLKDFNLSDDEKEIGSYAGWISNAGVARSMMSEITDRTNRAKGFSVYGFCWGIGMIGPAIGGYLNKPAERYPGVFGSIEFLKTYPYFLPCFVSSLGSFFGFIVGYFYLKESNPAILARQRRYNTRDAHESDDECRTLLSQHSHDSEEGVAKKTNASSLKNITMTSMTIILSYSLFSFCAMLCDEIIPLYFSAPAYAGGLDVGSPELAKALSILGLQQLCNQFLLYPRVSKILPTLTMVRIAFCLFIPVFILLPELFYLKEWLGANVADISVRQWAFRIGYMCLFLFRNLGSAFSYTGLAIMVNNSAESEVLGTVNG